MRTRIVGIGRGVPGKVLTNFDLQQIVNTSDDWITGRTGIKERRIADDGVVTSDLAAEAARQACTRAEVKPEELDCIIVATVTPDMPMPATAAFVQQKIGATTCPAFDISAASAGWLFGLGLADGLICNGSYRRVLVVGVELLSRVLDWTDRNTCVLFGDAAGAAVLVPDPDDSRGILGVEMCTDGSKATHLTIPGGGSVAPASHDTVEQRLHFVRMNGPQIFTNAVRDMSSASATVLRRCGYGAADVTRVFAHQSNLRILEGVSQRTGIPLDRFHINIQTHGNTSSASVPVALSEALEQGVIQDGDLLLFTAFGAGLSWASALVRW